MSMSGRSGESFLVARDCVQLGLRAGAVVLRNIHVTSASLGLRSEIAKDVQAVRARFASLQALRADPNVRSFQELLRKVGVNPRKEQPSLERLLGHAFKRADLPAINCLVDAYNLASVRFGCSLGAHDLDRIALPVELRLLTGSESFTPLGRDQAETVAAGEYGYVDAQHRVLCRLDILQAEFSKVTADTVNALLIIEGTASHSPEALRTAFAQTIDLVIGHCGGSAEIVAFPYEANASPGR
jgi:DNA/RNA-binding domain of Phe-tRNA-synthetase-like protein